MASAWWWMWMAFMFLMLLPPLGYGWGYRGWGPPYPRYVQNRRAARAMSIDPQGSPYDHQAWGWGGDYLWGVLLLGMFWASWAFWWR